MLAGGPRLGCKAPLPECMLVALAIAIAAFIVAVDEGPPRPPIADPAADFAPDEDEEEAEGGGGLFLPCSAIATLRCSMSFGMSLIPSAFSPSR
jgi:hypothetical protein